MVNDRIINTTKNGATFVISAATQQPLMSFSCESNNCSKEMIKPDYKRITKKLGKTLSLGSAVETKPTKGDPVKCKPHVPMD